MQDHSRLEEQARLSTIVVQKFGGSQEYRAVLRELVSGIRSLKLTGETTQRTRLEVEVFSALAAPQSFISIV